MIGSRDNSVALEQLPGWELISPGLRDFAAGRITVCSCLVAIAEPKLTRAGLLNGAGGDAVIHEPERTLYRLLQGEGGDAYGRYNSLLRRLVRFERALGCYRSKTPAEI